MQAICPHVGHELSDTLNPLERDELLSNANGVARLRRDLLHEQWLSRWFAQTTLGRVCPATTPGGARASIREGTRKLRMRAKGQHMHIDRANQVAVPGKAAGAARPIAVLGLVTMPTAGTLARCASFGASEAQDMDSSGFVSEVFDILAVFPAGHALVVMASSILIAHAMRIADEDGAYLVLDAELNDLPSGFVPHISDTSLGPLTDFILGALQLPPAARVFLAPGLLLVQLPQLLGSLPFERTNAAPGHDQGLFGVGGHGG